MADYPWNHTYVDGENFCWSPECYRTIAKAVNEKLRACGFMHYAQEPTVQAGVPALATSGASAVGPIGNPLLDTVLTGTVTADNGDGTFDVTVNLDAFGNTQINTCTPYTTSYAGSWPTPYTPSVGDSVLTTLDNSVFPTDYPGHPWSWPSLMFALATLVTYFIDPATWTDPAGYPDDGSWPAPTPLALEGVLTANGGGFTRKVERRIYSLADAGVDGQRARYHFCAGVEDDFVNPASSPSPAGERQYSTKVMLRQSGAWVQETDRLQQPDILTATNDPAGAGHYGFPEPGDIFGPWVVNDIQTVIAAMKQQWSQAVPSDALAFYSDDGSNSSNVDDFYASEAAAQAAAEAAFPGVAGPLSYTNGPGYQYYSSGGIGSGGPGTEWIVSIANVICTPTVACPNHCSRAVDFWVIAQVYSGIPGGVFDANGTALVENAYVADGTYGPGTAALAQGTTVGSAAHLPNSANKGYQVTGALALIRWDVAGGFQYI